jgi:catechol 2,3-dioxygenase-like lactoylglutathione lyase family enzyme
MSTTIAERQLCRLTPAFIVQDVQASIAFYEGKLGFRVKLAHGQPVEFAILRRDGCELIVKRGDALAGTRNRQQVKGDWFYDAMLTANRPEHVDELYAQMGGASFGSETPHTKDGMRVFSFTDPDGYRIFVHASE